MKIIFLSNYYNHHQAPFCRAMYNRLGDDFCFIQTEEMEAERCNMGWGEKQLPSFVKKSYDGSLSQTECKDLIENADAVIVGSAPEHLVKKRIKDGKLVLRYSERKLKKGIELWKYPYRYFKWHKNNPKHANIYVLCASAYTASDYAKFGLFRNRGYTWGYFPEVKEYNDVDALMTLKKNASIVWVARLIEWKHPELPVLVAKRLKDENYSFEMNLIGNGKLEEKIQNMIHDLDLDNCVHMLGSMKPEQVREHMEKSQMFLFTSDENEGWGAVLNEAMNSCCAVIASSAIGSAPLLINGENGIIYRDGDFEDLYSKVKLILDEPQKSAQFGKKAYETMISLWNAESATERLMSLLEDLNGKGKSERFENGPCSKAIILKDGWY